MKASEGFQSFVRRLGMKGSKDIRMKKGQGFA